MKIEWNKVTWYSKFVAVIIFLLTFFIAFNLGQKSALIKTQNVDIIVPKEQTTENKNTISITSKDIKEKNFVGKVAVITGSNLLASSAQAYIDKTVSEFRIQANKDVPDMRKEFGKDSPTANYEIDIDAKYVKGTKTESIAIIVYEYTGGAHGNSSYKVITTSLNTGKILTLSDIIKQAEQNAFTTFVKNKLNDWRPEGSVESVVFPEDVQSLKFDSFINWSMDDLNLVIYFSQYEIGPGVLGAVAFPIPLEEIKSFLNSNY